mgnify:CR=1 FL=1
MCLEDLPPPAVAVRVYQHPPGGESPRPPAPPAPLLSRPPRLASAERAHRPLRGPRQRVQLRDGGARGAGVGQLELDAVEGGVLLHGEVLQVTAHFVAKVFVMIGILSKQQIGFHLN